jgi:hypothetical protein
MGNCQIKSELLQVIREGQGEVVDKRASKASFT